MEAPRIGNLYLEDPLLQGYLRAHLPAQVFAEVNVDLERFGARLRDEIYSLGRECELNPPRLLHFDAWGQRVDQVTTCPAWKRLKDISAEESLVAEGYKRRYSCWSRVYQAAKLYLFIFSSACYTSPLAMTDGAAKVIESLGIPKPLEEAYARLTSGDPKTFWISGQWMTERKGGSDVGGGTETVARELPDGSYSLHGFKWFTSAADSDMTLTLARMVGPDGQVKQGSRGLSLFYLKIYEDGKLNGIKIERLKEKLGTRALPTAELLLDGARAHLISTEGQGIPYIANMLNIARIYNAVGAAGSMRRMVNLARDYATKREAFGKPLKDHPLHMQTLARMEVQSQAAFLLLMELARLLGLEETKAATEQEKHLLRLLTPLTKLYTAKQAIAMNSEGLECFGGQGFMEDTGVPVIVRDSQVLSIWEGTTNILSLDVLRCILKSQGKALDVFFSTAQAKLEAATRQPELQASVQIIQNNLQKLKQFVRRMDSKGEAGWQLAARDFAYDLAWIYEGVLLLEHAARAGASATNIYAAQRWCQEDVCLVDREEKAGSYNSTAASLDKSLVYDGYPSLRGKL
ncbi:acyl-CoA dehydrogenase family member 11-like isoform X1 [Pantherophis guttatus]|uniref:Acyl-CoA dehydrogenase family member 11-like isoform X1 n=1 Tax=Pantherophis guttatus TaxID=94885 RepID=A0ABM3YYA5_PANGU|nr:acyl-CoA dehydrogenase family member 11-like isoform X1 [Pantherophis guttatus]